MGLGWDAYLETLDFDTLNSFSGTSMGQIRRITEVSVRLFEAGLVSVRLADDPDTEYSLLDPRVADTLMDTAPPLLSGIYEVDIVPNFDLSSRLRFKLEGPLPATLSAIYFKAIVNEG